MEKRDELYRGKAKTVYLTDDEDKLILHFRDDTSAFDGEKIEQLARKGKVNNQFNHAIMQHLEDAGIPTQQEALLSEDEALVKKMAMIPVECVVRNVSAGSLVRRLGIEEGLRLNPPTFELFLKNDSLHDPMINESLAVSLGFATEEQLATMKRLTFKVNAVLSSLFDKAGMILVDYKLEFGVYKGEITLGDEFTPDGCRIWDKESGEKLDKDRFRQSLGNVVESYEAVARRLGIQIQ